MIAALNKVVQPSKREQKMSGGTKEVTSLIGKKNKKKRKKVKSFYCARTESECRASIT